MNILETAISFVDKSRDELNLHQSLDWCAETVKEIINRSDIPSAAKEVGTISCNQTFARMQGNGYWYEPQDKIKPADVIFFNWYHDYDSAGNLDHIGIVKEVHGDYIVTIEGNTEGRENWRTVKEKRRYFRDLDFNCKYPDYYMRYKPAPEPITDNEVEYILNDRAQLAEYILQLRKIANDLENFL